MLKLSQKVVTYIQIWKTWEKELLLKARYSHQIIHFENIKVLLIQMTLVTLKKKRSRFLNSLTQWSKSTKTCSCKKTTIGRSSIMPTKFKFQGLTWSEKMFKQALNLWKESSWKFWSYLESCLSSRCSYTIFQFWFQDCFQATLHIKHQRISVSSPLDLKDA